ncbi:MAG: hypothetical protein GXY52_01525 [Chloroflexi bacterium]|nr:hypothetical protein [Chloroflexota bacterium]
MLFYAHQYVTTTLSKVGGLNDSDTEGIVLSSIDGIDTSKPGIALLTYQEPLDITRAEWITYTSINEVSKELQGVQRGQEDSSPKNHDNGCAIAFPISKSHINNLNDAVIEAVPAGMVVPFAGSAAPTNWLLCDGSDASRTEYARLFEVIGTTYGEGDGSTTFGLPNLGGRVPVGKSADEEFNTLGKTGGAKTHTLTVNEMPSHNHSVNLNIDNPTGGGAQFTMNASVLKGVTDTIDNLRTYGSTSPNGWNVPHNNLQPYITLNYIIKT